MDQQTRLCSSMEELKMLARSQVPEINPAISLQRYYQTTQKLLDQARQNHEQKKFEMAFLFFLRYTLMILEKLPRHRDYNSLPRERAAARQNVTEAMQVLNDLKPFMQELYGPSEKPETAKEDPKKAPVITKKEEKDDLDQVLIESDDDDEEASEPDPYTDLLMARLKNLNGNQIPSASSSGPQEQSGSSLKKSSSSSISTGIPDVSFSSLSLDPPASRLHSLRSSGASLPLNQDIPGRNILALPDPAGNAPSSFSQTFPNGPSSSQTPPPPSASDENGDMLPLQQYIQMEDGTMFLSQIVDERGHLMHIPVGSNDPSNNWNAEATHFVTITLPDGSQQTVPVPQLHSSFLSDPSIHPEVPTPHQNQNQNQNQNQFQGQNQDQQFNVQTPTPGPPPPLDEDRFGTPSVVQPRQNPSSSVTVPIRISSSPMTKEQQQQQPPQSQVQYEYQYQDQGPQQQNTIRSSGQREQINADAIDLLGFLPPPPLIPLRTSTPQTASSPMFSTPLKPPIPQTTSGSDLFDFLVKSGASSSSSSQSYTPAPLRHSDPSLQKMPETMTSPAPQIYAPIPQRQQQTFNIDSLINFEPDRIPSRSNSSQSPYNSFGLSSSSRTPSPSPSLSSTSQSFMSTTASPQLIRTSSTSSMPSTFQSHPINHSVSPSPSPSFSNPPSSSSSPYSSFEQMGQRDTPSLEASSLVNNDFSKLFNLPSVSQPPPKPQNFDLLGLGPSSPIVHSTSPSHSHSHSQFSSLISSTFSVPSSSPTILRKVFLDAELIDDFSMFASYNTFERKIETCGILAARHLENVDSFHIDTVVIPQQEGQSDSCHSTNETHLFQYLQEHNLLAVGWIHTHPTQECFLSSVDLHAHLPYQLLLPEACAVVVAPHSQNKVGIFHLTEAGLKEIGSCREVGFHPQHVMSELLFRSCQHVSLVSGDPNRKVIDLR